MDVRSVLHREVAIPPARWLGTASWTRVALQSLVVFALFLIGMAVVQWGTTGLADNDGFYHIKMAWLMRERGLAPAFVWLPLSILSPQAFYDHHMLYHVYLAPFTGDGSPAAMITGAKLASVVMPALAFTAIWWLLRSQQVPWAAVWSMGLLAVSEAFLYRMSMPRAQAASLLILAVALWLLLTHRYTWLVPLGFVYVWLYNAFPLLLVVAGAYTGAVLLLDRRLEWRAVLFPLLGVLLGLVINPYFPQNAVFIINHLAPKLGESAVSVGNEWYPYNTWTLVQNSGAALLVWILGMLGLGLRGRRMDRATLTAVALSIVFGLMLLKSRRFVEYFPPFALIFAALSLGPLLRELIGARRRLLRAAPLLLAVVIAVPLVLTVLAGRTTMAGSKPADTYAGASAWLASHTPPGSLVFQTDWDDFPRLFFYNSHNIYLIGLDPTYLQLYDQQLYDEWVAITRGQVERPARIIQERFGASYVHSDLQHRDFMRVAAEDPQLREVYRDLDSVIYAVLVDP